MDHLVTLRIIAEECHNDKTDLLCCFIDFRIFFYTAPGTNLYNRLEEMKVPFELRDVAIRLCWIRSLKNSFCIFGKVLRENPKYRKSAWRKKES